MKTLKNIKLIFLIFIGIHFLSSCRNDSLITNLTESPSIPEKRVEAHITGFITDLNGIAIKNAKVSVINNSVFTDDQGAFNIIGLVNERHAIINIEKNGYFKQFKTISLTSSKTSITRTRIQLIEKTVT
jgi:hypothetical protein